MFEFRGCVGEMADNHQYLSGIAWEPNSCIKQAWNNHGIKLIVGRMISLRVKLILEQL